MYVGNIVTDFKIENENFKISNKLEDTDTNLPTLIIGWKNIKEIMGDKVSILHKQINNRLFWTFSPKERKAEYETDLDFYMTYCYNYFGENIPYVYLDLIMGKNGILWSIGVNSLVNSLIIYKKDEKTINKFNNLIKRVSEGGNNALEYFIQNFDLLYSYLWKIQKHIDTNNLLELIEIKII